MPNPQIELIARGVLIRNGQLLVCQNVKHEYLFLPGGHIEPGESGNTALIREMMEETGRAVSVVRLLGVFEASFHQKRASKPSKFHHEVNLIFEMELDEDVAVQSIESKIAFRWVDMEALKDGIEIRPAGILSIVLDGENHATSMSE